LNLDRPQAEVDSVRIERKEVVGANPFLTACISLCSEIKPPLWRAPYGVRQPVRAAVASYLAVHLFAWNESK
jgi:hypothetical protein